MEEFTEIDKAIAAHAKWKFYLREAIETGKSDRTVESVRPANVCAFGKWLYSLPAPQKLTEHWKKVQDLHAKFHIEAAKVLELALAGHQAQAKDAMAPGGPFATVSSHLTTALMAWKKAR
jgi:hypothetical protein